MRYAYLLALLVCAALQGQHGPLRIVDAHVHADPSTSEAALTDLFRQWDAAGVSGGVSMLPRGSDAPAAATSRLIHCAGIAGEPDLKGLEAGLKSGKFRCAKIYLGYVHQYASDRRYLPVYRLAAKYKIPIVFHTGDTSSRKAKLKFADPLTIDEVAVDHPDVTFVIAHLGNPWIESAAEVAYKNPNVFLEGSALLTGDMREIDPATVERYVVEPLRWAFGYLEDPQKLLFASDWPLVAVPAYVDAFKRAIPKEHWNAVFRENALRVFRLPATF